MFDSATLFAYFIAVIAIVLAPGPGQMLVLTRTLSGGRNTGLATTLGLNIGTLVHTLAAAFGLSAILATSALAFSLVKYAGAVYLIYLGIQAFRSNHELQLTPDRRPAGGSQALSQAIVTGILNPKVALFFLAFLPQFVHPERGATTLQFIILGVMVGLVGIAWDCVLILTLGSFGDRLACNPRFNAWRQWLTGGILIGLGLRLAWPERS